MGETAEVNFSAFVSGLSPDACACFIVLSGNARDTITKSGPQAIYEKPLAEFMNESGIGEMETVANSIRQIIQRKIECKQGEFLYFFPFLTSISIEEGIIKYSLPKEIENAIPQMSVPGNS